MAARRQREKTLGANWLSPSLPSEPATSRTSPPSLVNLLWKCPTDTLIIKINHSKHILSTSKIRFVRFLGFIYYHSKNIKLETEGSWSLETQRRRFSKLPCLLRTGSKRTANALTAVIPASPGVRDATLKHEHTNACVSTVPVIFLCLLET